MRNGILVFVYCAATLCRADVTGFEDVAVGSFTELKTKVGVFSAEMGHAQIDEAHADIGKRCLHIPGGQNRAVELQLATVAGKDAHLSMRLERWTRRDPFVFRVSGRVDRRWRELYSGDAVIKVGGFHTEALVALPENTDRLRFSCTAPDGAGVMIDDFRLLKEKPVNVDYAPEPPKVATDPIKTLIYNETLFVSGTKETHTFRIPAIITAQNGDLIAVCDARRKKGGDLIWSRLMDIAIRRSSDNGKTWTEMELVCEFGDGRPASDPSLILDESTGEIFCFYNYMDQDNAPKEFRLYVQSSKDHGKTWGEARDITDAIAKPEWKMDFKFIASGRGIQTRDGELLHCMVNLKRGLHIFGSKDHGESWYLKDVPLTPGNESKVIELADGRLMVNCRHNGGGARWVHLSEDRGKSWVGHKETSLVDPGCNGSILRYTSVKDGYAKNRLLFSNANAAKGRKNLAVRISYDEGATWSDGKVIDAGPSAYSDLTICADGTIGVLYEPGYKEVRFVSFTLEDLTDGKDSLQKSYRVPGL